MACFKGLSARSGGSRAVLLERGILSVGMSECW